MSVRITVLCDNTVGPISGTLGEHGFSALIEQEGAEPVLFDTGQGDTLLHNARRMNKDLAKVHTVILSHGHFDHCGGLLPLLHEYGSKRIFSHPALFSPCYRKKDTGDSISIGIPHDRNTLETAGARFDLSADFRAIAPDMFLTGEVPRTVPFETGDRGLFSDRNGQVQDSTSDDQSLVLETSRGLVLVLGCCHAGLVNTLEHVTHHTGRRDYYAILGGTHLGFCGQEQINKTIAVLKKMDLNKLAASHCTGFTASARLAHELPTMFQPAHVGYTLEA